MKIEVNYWQEASSIMEILIDNGYEIEIETKANYPFDNVYIVTIKEKGE